MITLTIYKHLDQVIKENKLSITIDEVINHVQTRDVLSFQVRRIVWLLYTRSVLFSTDALSQFFQVKEMKIISLLYRFPSSAKHQRNQHRA